MTVAKEPMRHSSSGGPANAFPLLVILEESFLLGLSIDPPETALECAKVDLGWARKA